VGDMDVVEVARSLAPQIRDLSDTIEQNGEMPAQLAGQIADAGLFQMYLPAAAGGPQLDPLRVFQVTEALARADGSVAWCVSISTAISSYLALISPEAARQIAGERPRLRLAGSARPLGSATQVEGGYRVTGRWDFASNVLQSQWYVGTSVIEGQNTAEGPKTRAMIMPVEAGEVIRTWDTLGMRGTGSHDFAVEDLFVPTDFTAAARHAISAPVGVYQPRLAGVTIWSPTVGVALGLARGALDDFEVLARRRGTGSPVPLRDRGEIQMVYGEAEAIVGAARAYVVAAVSTAWEAVEAGLSGADLDEPMAQARLAITHGMNEALRVVDLLQRAAGTNGLFKTARLERRFRDLHTAVQHAAGVRLHIQSAGRVFLGLPADAPYF